LGLPLGAPVHRCDEAGRDGCWLHRWLLAHAVDNVMVEASSIEVNRRARRAKTDRLDTSTWLARLLRWHGGERHVWRVVHVPSPEAAAHRQVTRALAMNDALVVCRFQRLGDLFRDRDRFIDWRRATGDPLRKILALYQFHHERRNAVALFEPVDAGNVRMVQ
jgi:hypothetical protein